MEGEKSVFLMKREDYAPWSQQQQSGAAFFQIFTAANFECTGLGQKGV